MAPAGVRPNARGLATRAHLERAALELFHANGFAAVTIDDITDRAGVSRRSFFRHFASKDEVLWGDVDGQLSRLTRILFDQPITLTTRQALLAAIATEAEQTPRSALDALRVQVVRANDLAAVAAARWEAQLTEIFATWIGSRLRRSPADVAVRGLAASVVAVRRICVAEWVERMMAGTPVGIVEVASEALRLVGFPDDGERPPPPGTNPE